MEPSPLPMPTGDTLNRLFPARRISPEEIGGIPPELGDYRRDFGNLTWREVPEAVHWTHTDAFCLMDHETLVHFIAGFMRLSLPGEKLLEQHPFIFFAASDRFCNFCRLLTREQLLCVLGFVDHLIMNEWYSEVEQIPYQENREKLLSAGS